VAPSGSLGRPLEPAHQRAACGHGKTSARSYGSAPAAWKLLALRCPVGYHRLEMRATLAGPFAHVPDPALSCPHCLRGVWAMKLNLLPSEDGITRLASEGDITLYEVQGCVNPLQSALGPDGFRHKVLLSLAQSCFIDSAGVGWLILAHKKFSEAGGLLVVHSLPPLVNHSFRVLQVGSILHLADNEAAALKIARGTAAAQPAAASADAECD